MVGTRRISPRTSRIGDSIMAERETHNGRIFELAYGHLSKDAQRIMRFVEEIIESHKVDNDDYAVSVLHDVTDYAIDVNTLVKYGPE
jgi:hypothetical protein